MGERIMQNTSDPAFPCGEDGFTGMSRRDWYAGRIIPSIYLTELRMGDILDYELVAQKAFRMADAMIAEADRPT